jgi:hypothetical protein
MSSIRNEVLPVSRMRRMARWATLICFARISSVISSPSPAYERAWIRPGSTSHHVPLCLVAISQRHVERLTTRRSAFERPRRLGKTDGPARLGVPTTLHEEPHKKIGSAITLNQRMPKKTAAKRTPASMIVCMSTPCLLRRRRRGLGQMRPSRHSHRGSFGGPRRCESAGHSCMSADA